MKISKLFHWLYAFLMALPIFAVLSACLISTFNMSSKQESEINYRFETNEVNSVNDLVIGNIYKLSYNLPVVESIDKICDIQNVFNFTRNTLAVLVEAERQNNKSFYISNTTTNLALYSDGSLWLVSDSKSHQVNNFIYIVYDGDFNVDYLSYIGISDYSPISSVVTNNLNVQDIFYNAIDNVRDSSLFSWAYNSNILGVPISYIGGIFGLASNSIVNVLLCYWVAISIIWLVFDVLMFVPLLVHKIIDKMRF